MAMPRDYVKPLALILLVLLGARIVALAMNGTDLYFDESQYWAWSREPAFGYYSKPPLIAWLIALSTSVCGDGEFCVRLPAPFIHTATAFLVFLLGRALYGPRTGYWSAIAYATLPGVSVSSGIISTDVPLLFAWALALVALAGLLFPSSSQPGTNGGAKPDTDGQGVASAPYLPLEGEGTAPRLPGEWSNTLILGVALGLGLNAKYAMAWFAVCAAIYVWLEPAARAALKRPPIWLALLLGILLIVPNLIWNSQHSFATFSHTADNAKWEGSLFHPLSALEFIGAQFGVFGPVLFGTLIALLWRAWSGAQRLDPRDRLLVAFSVPLVAIITLQALISRAHPNWAAIAYVPAVVLVTAYMLRNGEERWRDRSLIVNGALAILIVIATTLAGRFALPVVGDPLARTMGNRELASLTRDMLADARARGRPFQAILTDDREQTASLLYYARAEPTPVLAWRTGPRPRDHFELMQPFVPGQPEPLLLVTRKTDPSGVTGAFQKAEELGSPGGLTQVNGRKLRFFSLSGYRKP